MKVENGAQNVLKCLGYVTESKCGILERDINFGIIPVCKRSEAIITIKN